MSAEDTVGTPVTGDNDETYVPPAGYTYNDPVWDDPNWLERLFGGTGTTNDKLLAMLGFGLASLIENRNRQPAPITSPEYVPAPVYDRALTAPMRDVNSLGSKLFFNPNPFQLDPVEAAKKYGPSPEEIQSAADIYRTGLASLQVPDDAPIFNASNTRGKRYVANATAPVKLMDVLNQTPIVPPAGDDVIFDAMPIPDDVAGPAVMVDDGNGGMTDWRNNPTGSPAVSAPAVSAPVTAPSVLEQSNAFAPTPTSTASAYTPNVGTSWSELLAPFNGARWDGAGGEDTSAPNWALWNAVSQYKALQEPPPELWTINHNTKIQQEKDLAATLGRPYEGNWETKSTWTPPQAELDRQRAILESWASNPSNQYYDPTSEFFNQQLYDQNWGPNSQPTRPPNAPLPYASGGPVRGPGTGTSDSIPALINGRQPARLSDGEYVLPASFVSALGGGSNSVGTARIQNMVDRAMNRFRRA